MKHPDALEPRDDREIEVLEREDLGTCGPDSYCVIILNDDYTPMEFVVVLLETIFRKSPTEAYGVMMRVHRDGRGVAGIYPFEIAETKAERVAIEAQANGYPLRAITEADKA